MNEAQLLGSRTAKQGFQNEQDVVDKFNNWKEDETAQEWLRILGYSLESIDKVEAYKVSGHYKADVQVSVVIRIKLKEAVDYQNIQVKLVSNEAGFNQIDKRWVNDYKQLWSIPDDVVDILKRYTGETAPNIEGTRDKRRMFMDEFTQEERNKLVNWLKQNSVMIVTDIMKGRGKFAAEWLLVVQKVAKNARWHLVSMNIAMNYFTGDVEISDRGNIHIGKITMQRKGGDGGRDTANMLQFKINPALIFDLK